jgi:phosphoribosylaminoimidazole-succinocarboxamide synthase
MYRHPFLDGGAAPEAFSEIGLSELPLLAKGKVREIYDLGDQLLFVSTDRISAFDVVMSEPIPGKGIVLTSMSAFWFERFGGMVKNHFISDDPDQFPAEIAHRREQLAGRAMLVKKCQRIDIECVVRCYLRASLKPENSQRCGLPRAPKSPRGTTCRSRVPRRLTVSATN